MHRLASIVCVSILLIAGICPIRSNGQSLADAARENRKTKNVSTASKVITGDDLSASADEVTIQLVPGATSNGDGTLVAPGRAKHSYAVTNLDATRFIKGGVLHITITVGDGPAEASFDLYPKGARLPSEGIPHPLAFAHNVQSGADGKINYRFDHGNVFQLAAEGSWNAKAGDRNTYSFVIDVGNP